MQKFTVICKDIRHQFFHCTKKQMFFAVLGNVIMALGIALFTQSDLGNSPFHSQFYGMEKTFAGFAGGFFTYAVCMILLNIVMFIIELVFAHRLIGFGSCVNMFLLGYTVTFFSWVLNSLHIVPQNFAGKLGLLLLAMPFSTLGLAVYSAANAGVSPYDSLPLILTHRTKIPFFWARIIVDGTAFLVTLIFSGPYGLGTVVSVILTGPLAAFLDKNVCRRLIGTAAAPRSKE